ncbi:MAG: hypothetical protein JW963_00615 [Anaerolineales bacterium]|nr:hypothetical protein [Anaerolineales bacterium]
MTTWQRKISEYEADLYRVHTSWWAKLFLSSKGGEMEVKHYEGGEKRMEIDLHGVKCPDGARVSVVIDGKVVREVEVRRGFARVRLSSADGEIIPDVHNGSAAEIHYMGEALLEGTFKFD